MTDTDEPVEIDPKDRSMLERIGRLRVLAWSTVIPDAATKTDCWLDVFDPVARHWCFIIGGEPVAAARMSVHQRIEDVPDAEVYAGMFANPPAPIASFNRLVIHPGHRGRGWAELFDRVRLTAAEQTGCGCAIGETQSKRRIEQLKRSGFVVVGPCRTFPAEHFLNVWGDVVFCRLPRSQSG